MSIRLNAESAAFFRSGAPEREKADAKLNKLIKTMQLVAVAQYALNCKLFWTSSSIVNS